MAPKKKGGKKQQDDWESELGETVDPIAQAEEQAKQEDAAKDAEEEGAAPAGGLMGMLRKRGKKGKGGKALNDFVEGEDATDGDANGTPAEPEVDLSNKAPEEATMEDEDVFGQSNKKGKAGKGGKPEPKKAEEDDEDDDEADASGRVLTKKEKEKLKKEREKQRKKEQVRLFSAHALSIHLLLCVGRIKEEVWTRACREERGKGCPDSCC